MPSSTRAAQRPGRGGMPSCRPTMRRVSTSILQIAAAARTRNARPYLFTIHDYLFTHKKEPICFRWVSVNVNANIKVSHLAGFRS